MTLHDPAGRRIYGIDNAHAVRLPFILIRCYMAEIDHELEVLLGLDGYEFDFTRGYGDNRAQIGARADPLNIQSVHCQDKIKPAAMPVSVIERRLPRERGVL